MDLESKRDSIKIFETRFPEEPDPDTEVGESIDPVESDMSTETAEIETVTAETPPSETTPPETAVPETPPATADQSGQQGTQQGGQQGGQQGTQSSEGLLDFDSLKAMNPDVHAWIEIEGTKVDYPVLQSPDNDEKYLTTAFDGSYYIGGSIFTQATYNNTDFNDPVTAIYGHTMKSGTLFGQLQSVYTNASTFASHNDIIIYLPGEVRHYTVFAAVPFENFHIMHAYDFSSKYWFESFFDRVSKVRAFNANFDKDSFPEYGDRVIILSTCLNEDSTQRFLVMAVCRDDIAD